MQSWVRRIEPGGFTKISAMGVEEQRVRAIIDISRALEQRRQLGDGFRVALRIITRSQEGAALLPDSAVFPLPGVRARIRGPTLVQGTKGTKGMQHIAPCSVSSPAGRA